MKRSAISLSLVVSGIVLSIAVYITSGGDGPLFYYGILPGLPFVILGILGFIPRNSLKSILGAAVGVLLVTVFSYGSLYLLPRGSGLTGPILLIIPLPIYYAIAMIVGWFVGTAKE